MPPPWPTDRARGGRALRRGSRHTAWLRHWRAIHAAAVNQATGWTVPLLARYLRQGHGIMVNARTLRRRLHEAGYRWKRPRYVFAERAAHLAQRKGG